MGGEDLLRPGRQLLQVLATTQETLRPKLETKARKFGAKSEGTRDPKIIRTAMVKLKHLAVKHLYKNTFNVEIL